MTMREPLKALIAQMRWSGIARVLDEELDLAERQGTPVPEVLLRLLSAEDAARREKSLAYRLAQAHLPWPWTLQSFPFARQPSVNKAQVLTLAGLEFLRRGENLLLIGPPGTGKSGIAVGLLREACLNGYRARFYDAQAPLDELYASRRPLDGWAPQPVVSHAVDRHRRTKSGRDQEVPPGDFRRHRFSPATGQASPTPENAGLHGSKRDTAALTATPQRIAPPLGYGQAAKKP